MVRVVRVMCGLPLAFPPLLRIDQAAGVAQGLAVGPLAPLRGVGAPALPAGHGALGLAVAGADAARERAVVSRVVVVVVVQGPRARVEALEGLVAVGAFGLGLALPGGAQAVVPDGGDAADAAGDVAGQLGHEEDVPVAHHRDGALAHEGLMVAYHGAGEVQQVFCAAVDLARGSVRRLFPGFGGCR